VIAYRGDCDVEPLNYPNENNGYCSEQLFSIKLGNTEIVAVHIQAVDSRKEMRELSRYSQNEGLKKLSDYMKTKKPDVVLGDFNLSREELSKKFKVSNFDIVSAGYSFADIDIDFSGGNIYHALSKNAGACIKYISDVQTHLTTAMFVEIKC